MKLPLLITNPSNISYVTGFAGTLGYVLLTQSAIHLITDGRYIEAARTLVQKKNTSPNIHFNQMKLEVHDCSKGVKELLTELLKKHKNVSLSFEEEHMSVTKFELLKKHLRKHFTKVSLFGTTGYIEQIRTIKSDLEIQHIKKAQKITDEVLRKVKKEIKINMSEKELAWKIQELIHKYGADEESFPTIVAFAEHTAIPHHHPTNKKLKKGQMILIDMGVRYKGYCSDMTRTLFTKTPTPEQKMIYMTVLKAQKLAIKKIKPGVPAKKIDAYARNIIAKAGFAQTFTHSFGHGVGLDIHEAPTLSTKNTDILKTGMVITAEPGIYLTGEFGVRIEDMLVVTKTGAENITANPKEIKESMLTF